MRLSFTSLVLILLAMGPPPALEGQEGTVIFLVRHAERADDTPSPAMDPQMLSEDPPLSEAGKDRAKLLATMLRDVGLSQIHSTDYLRTRETVRPTAESSGIEVSLYDARDLETFARSLLNTPGTHLVVGHSNTTPALVEALGGTSGLAIQPLEYDRLYLVIARGGTIRTILLRFGNPFAGTDAAGK